jgi:hypothetical protein
MNTNELDYAATCTKITETVTCIMHDIHNNDRCWTYILMNRCRKELITTIIVKKTVQLDKRLWLLYNVSESVLWWVYRRTAHITSPTCIVPGLCITKLIPKQGDWPKRGSTRRYLRISITSHTLLLFNEAFHKKYQSLASHVVWVDGDKLYFDFSWGRIP